MLTLVTKFLFCVLLLSASYPHVDALNPRKVSQSIFTQPGIKCSQHGINSNFLKLTSNIVSSTSLSFQKHESNDAVDGKHLTKTAVEGGQQDGDTAALSVGDDSAAFSLTDQKFSSWIVFGAAVATVLGFLYEVWIAGNGPLLGDQYLHWMEGLAHGDSTLVITYMLGFFAVCHSGLASLRSKAEEIIGARAWRVIFALVSLPLAFSSIVYFINHRYDGIHLWDLRLAPGMHEFVFVTSLISFFFLYPSTFNLLEVAAVDKPKLHLWETGIIRITRFDFTHWISIAMVGQVLWCLAHTAYVGTTFTCATSAMLCLHHIFAVWNGDRRLRDKFGPAADEAFERTSVIPFQAILSGKQELPDNFLSEFIRLPYLTVLIGTLIAYQLHPFMQAGSALLKW